MKKINAKNDYNLRIISNDNNILNELENDEKGVPEKSTVLRSKKIGKRQIGIDDSDEPYLNSKYESQENQTPNAQVQSLLPDTKSESLQKNGKGPSDKQCCG